MHLFDLINTYPQFIHYIINNDIVLFSHIFHLAKVCRELRNYFHRMFKAYDMICKYHCKKINMSIFSKPELFYLNSYEKELFQKMCYPQLYKTDLSLVVICNSIVIMDLYISQFNYCVQYDLINLEKFNKAIRIAVENNNIIMLNKLICFGYVINDSGSLINLASNYGYVECLDWFYNTS